MAYEPISAPVMHALAEATDAAFAWADDVTENGGQAPGRLALAAETADALRGYGFEIRPITGTVPAPVCTDCGGPGGYHSAGCYSIVHVRDGFGEIIRSYVGPAE